MPGRAAGERCPRYYGKVLFLLCKRSYGASSCARCETRRYRVAKFRLDPIRMQRSGGLRRPETRRIERTIEQNRTLLMEAWDECFDD